MKKLIVVAALLSSSAFAAEPGWFQSEKRGPSPVPPIIIEVEVMPDGCLQNRTPFVKAQGSPKGCYYPWHQDKVFPYFVNPGWILLAKRMPPWERECVLEHEMKHDKGEDHDVFHQDCK